MEEHKNQNILIVDDVKENLISLEAILTRSGLKVFTAISGNEALKLLIKHEFGLVILDVQMPEMDGFEVLEFMKGNSRTKFIPVLFLSALATQKEFFLKGLQIGAVDYMTKPFDADLLLLKINNFLKLSYSENQLRKSKNELALLHNELKFKYKSLVENMNDAFILKDSNGKIIFANNRFLEIFGFNSEEIQNLEIEHYVEVEYQKILIDWQEKIREGLSGAKSFEFRGKRKDGKIIWLESRETAIQDEELIIGTQSIIIDITQRKEMEEKLFLNYKFITNTEKINQAIINDTSLEEVGKILLASLEDLVGINYSMLFLVKGFNILKPISHNKNGTIEVGLREEFMINEKLTQNETLYKVIVKQEIEWLTEQNEFRGKNKFPFLTSEIINDDTNVLAFCPVIVKGETNGILVFSRFTDLTAKERNLIIRFIDHVAIALDKSVQKQNLLISEKRYRSLFEDNLAGVFRIQMNRVFVDCNQAFANIIGVKDKKQIIGKMMEELYTLKSHPDLIKHISNNGGKISNEEIVLQKKRNGDDTYILLSASIIYNSKNRPVYVDGTAIDITRRKNFENQLKTERNQSLQYQSMLLSSQMNPHFIFNALNSVQYYILDQNIEPALNFISEFSKLIRKTLENSNFKLITISDEINYLKLYLDLERRRYNDKFEYTIKVNNKIDTQSYFIPPMILQPYVENTVIHGLGNRLDNGSLRITFSKLKDNMICEISDNGIGREKAKELRKLRKGGQDHKSMGMNIIQTRINLLREINQADFNVTVTDIKNKKGEAQGTKVKIIFPKIEEGKLTNSLS